MAGVIGKCIRPRIAYDSVRAVHGPSAGEHSGFLFLNNNECLMIWEAM
jgi:hypothetical protein